MNNNLLFLIALVVGLGVAYIAIDQAYSTGNAFWNSRPVPCFDSDKGLNYSVAGYVQYRSSKKFDYCANNILFEGWCSARGGPTFARYECPNGCKSGACAPSSSVPSQVTFKDGDAYIGQNVDDPDWVWDLADFNTPNPKMGVENDFVWNDPTDKPVGVGQCIKLPNDYIKVCLESLNNDYSKTTYTFELDKNADLSHANVDATSVPALYLHSPNPHGFEIAYSDLEFNNTGSGLTDKVWLWICSKPSALLPFNSSLLGVYYKDSNDKTQMAGCLDTTSLVGGNYKFLLSLNQDIKVWVTKKSDNRLELKISPGSANNDDLKMLWSYNSYGFDFRSLGSIPSLEESSELSWYGYNDTTDGWTGSDGYISVNIGAFDLDQRTRFGAIVRNPKVHGASDDVVLDIPSKQVEAVITVSGAFNDRFSVPLGVPISNRSLVYSKYTPLEYMKSDSNVSLGSVFFTYPIETLELGKAYNEYSIPHNKFVKTVTSLTSGNKDYQTGVFLEADVDALKYYKTIPTDLTKVSATNPLKIKFLGKELTITSVDTSNPSSPKIVVGSGCGSESKVVSSGDTCCSGLSKISNSYYYGTECKTNKDEYVCTAKCGDGSCSGRESYCNCPQDCTPISEIGLGLSVGQNISLGGKSLVLVSVDSSGDNVTVRVNDVFGVIEKGSTKEVNGLIVKVISTNNVADPSKRSGLFYLKTSSSTSYQFCTDSDGEDYYSRGNGTGTNTPEGPVYDTCIDSQKLDELICREKEIVDTTFTCPNGCKDGACIKQEQPKTAEYIERTLFVGGSVSAFGHKITLENVGAAGSVVINVDSVVGVVSSIPKVVNGVSVSVVTSNYSDVKSDRLAVLRIWSATSPTLSGNCKESDGGKNYEIKGNLTFNNREVYTDYCKDSTSSTVPLPTGKYLNEMYCPTPNSYSSSEYVCPYGCKDGACTQTPTTNQTQSCVDQCSSSWQSCTSNSTSSWYAPCGNFDSDSCLEWGPVNYCAAGSTCSCQNNNCSCI